MPESMFGRPLQHLLPSQPQSNAGGSSTPSDPVTPPVQLAPLPFKDFRFNSIGKQPELLSRISLPQPGGTDYHSPTPSPRSTPPTLTNDVQSMSSSRPTLYQQLTGSVFSSTGESSKWNASMSQSNGSLASRIQMNDSPSNDIANAHGTASRFPSPLFPVSTVGRATQDANLIPPVEVLPQPPDSSPPTPASWAPTQELADVLSPANSTPLVNMTTITTSRIPTPTVATDTVSSGAAEPLAIVDVPMRDLKPSPSSTTTIDSLMTRQVRLQSISARLANLAPPLPPPSQSPPPDSYSIERTSANIIPDEPSQSQHSLYPVVLRHPYPADQTSDRVGSSINDAQTQTNDSSLALVHSPTILAQGFQAQSKAIVVAVQNLNSALNAAHRVNTDNENALGLKIRTFEEQQAAFEQTKRAAEATLQQAFQELQLKREELNAKEALLTSLEKENKAREEARKGVFAKRQAQEEDKRAAEAKRVQEVQEQIATAMNELKEIEVLKAQCQLEQLAGETVQDDLPTEPQEGMNEEERVVIKSRIDLLCAVKHLRRMHADKVQKLEEANRTLRRLGVERNGREAEEAERRRSEEERVRRAHAQIPQDRQFLDEKRRQFGAERKRQGAEDDCDQARLLVEQQAHAEGQAHNLGRTEVISDRISEHPSHSREITAPQQQGIADTAGIRAARKENSLPPETIDVMNVDDDGRAFALHRTVSSSNNHTSPGTSHSKQKKDKPISGGVMLTVSTPKTSLIHLPSKPSTTPPSFSSSNHVAENATNPAIPASAEGSYRSSFPAQPAPGFSCTTNADIRSTPDYKPAFSRTPKSQTILDATNGGSQELNIGPVSGVSPTQQNVNLRHLKRIRDRGEGTDSGTIQVKSEENSYLSLKREEPDDQPRELAQVTPSTNPPASLPPRPAMIPPPRPRMFKKRHGAPAPQIDSSSFNPPTNSEPLRREAETALAKQPREALPRGTPSSQAMDAPVQQPTSSEIANSPLLGPVYAEPQASESRINAGDRSTQDCGENYDSTPSEPASTSLSHELDGEDPARNNGRFTDERRRARNANGSRRVSDHYSPPSRSTVAPPTQAHRLIDSWHTQKPSNGSRAEPMRAPSPTVGRKRPSEFNDNEHGRRARRQRDDVRTVQDHDRDRVDSYRPHWDRRLDSGSDGRRPAYRPATSPVDRTRPYPSDAPRATYDNRTYAPEEPIALAARWEQSRRTESDDPYQRYQPSAPAYSQTADQHHMDDARVGQTYEPTVEERMDAQPDPSLLARMRDTQYFPPRGRGRGEPSRGRGDFGRGRGRGVARGGTPLLERLRPGPSSLEERITGF